MVIALDSVTYFFQEKNVFSLRFPSSSAFVVFRGLATSPEEHLLGDTNKPVQVFLVKWIPPAHPTPQACPSGSGGGAGGRFWILIQFLLRAITVSLQATQAAGYVCTENSAVGGETKGKETGGGGVYAPKSHGASDRQQDSTASESGLPEAGEGELIPQSPVRPEAAGSFGQKKALGSSRLSVPVGLPGGFLANIFMSQTEQALPTYCSLEPKLPSAV